MLVRTAMPVLCATIAFGVALGCGSQQAPVASQRPVGDPRFPIVPLHLAAMEGAHGSAARTNLDLRPDGSLYIGDAMVGRIAGARLLDARGQELFAAVPNASVTIQRRRRRVEVGESGSLLFDDNERVYFDDTGRVVSSRPGHPPQWLFMQMPSIPANAAGTAALMVLFTMVHGTRR